MGGPDPPSSVVPTQSEDELCSTKVTDRSNYTLLSKAQHKDKDDDKSVDKFKTDEPVESNATENAIETKLVESNATENAIETKLVNHGENLYKPYKTQ